MAASRLTLVSRTTSLRFGPMHFLLLVPPPTEAATSALQTAQRSSLVRHTSHARLTDDEFCRHEHPSWRPARVPEELQQGPGGFHAVLSQCLPHRRQWRIQVRGKVHVVKTSERDILGNAQPARSNGFERPGRRGVVGAEDGVDTELEELRGGGDARLAREVAVDQVPVETQ